MNNVILTGQSQGKPYCRQDGCLANMIINKSPYVIYTYRNVLNRDYFLMTFPKALKKVRSPKSNITHIQSSKQITKMYYINYVN